jgi:chitodextrinase/FlaG/FlaF family flagellin (archaellin)
VLYHFAYISIIITNIMIRTRNTHNGVSPVISVVLIVAIVVALVSLVTVVVFQTSNNNQDDTSVAGVQVENADGTNVTVKLVNDERTSKIIVETVGGQKTLSEIGETATLESFGEQVNIIGVTEKGSESVIRTFNPSSSSEGTVSTSDPIFVNPDESTSSSEILSGTYDTLEQAEKNAESGDSIIIKSGIHTKVDTVQATVSKDVTIGVQKNTIFKCASVNGFSVNLNFTRAPAVAQGAQNIATRGCGNNVILPPPVEDNFAVSLDDRTVLQGEETTITANISDIGVSDIDKIEWDFGDGNGATGNPVVNTFASTGSYTVTVDVTSNEGSTETASAVFNVVSSPPGSGLDPVAAFTYSPDFPSVNQKVIFNASESADQDGSISSYQWDVDSDGTFEQTGIEASKVYPSTGEKNVRLRVTDNDGNTDDVISSVRVGPRIGTDPIYHVSISNKTVPVGEESLFFANITDINEEQISSVDWSFGDGSTGTGNPTTHAYSTEGEYTFSVSVTSDEGIARSDTAIVNVTSSPPPVQIDPDAAIDISPTDPRTNQVVKFSGSESQDIDGSIVSYEWDLDNDGAFEQTGEKVSRTYDYFGVQDVALRVTDNDGNTDTARSSLFIDRTIGLPENFAVSIENKTVPVSEKVLFSPNISNIDKDDIQSISWSFGDGSTATGALVNNTYSSTGEYTVTVDVTSDRNNVRSDTAIVNVTSSPPPVQIDPDAAIEVAPAKPAINQLVKFSGSRSQDIDGLITSYEWDIDSDGTFEKTGERVTNAFDTFGSQDIVLKVTDNDGNTDSAVRSVFVDRDPTIVDGFNVSIENKTTPVGESTLFSADISGIGQGNISSVSWDFGDGNTGTKNPTRHTYGSTGEYSVSVTVTSAKGVKSSDTATVNVTSSPPPVEIDPEAAINITPDNPDRKETVLFNGSGSQDIDGSISSYQWDLDNDGSFEQTGVEVSRSYDYIGEQDVVIRVTDDDGNADETVGSVLITNSSDGGDGGDGGDDGNDGGGSSAVTGTVEVNPEIDEAKVISVDESGDVIETTTTNSFGEYEIDVDSSGDTIRVVTKNDTMVDGRGFYASAEREVDLSNAGGYTMDFNFTDTVNATVNGDSVMVAYGISQVSTPKQIGTQQELQAIETTGESTYELVRDINMSETKNWNGGNGFVPLGTSSNPFKHTLNGSNHTIKGLYMQRSGTSVSESGLISRSQGAKIKNLHMENFNSEGGYGSSALMAWSLETVGNEPTIVKNVKFSDGKVKTDDYSPAVVVGNSAHFASQSASGSETIMKKITTTNVTIDTTNGFGGLVGYGGDDMTLKKSNISLEVDGGGHVSTMGDPQANVTVTNTRIDFTHKNGTGWSAGISIGANADNHKHEVENVDVKVDINTKSSAAGAINQLYNGYARNVSVTGDIDVSGSGSYITGGVIGYARGGPSESSTGGNITDIYSNVDIDAVEAVGGIIGSQTGLEINRAYSEGSVNGSSEVGGIVGLFEEGKISNSHTVATVTGTGTEIGGATGKLDNFYYPSTYNDVYYDIGRTGQSSANGNSTGLTSTEMELSSNFEFDFSNRWSMNPYPVLDIREPQGNIGYSD